MAAIAPSGRTDQQVPATSTCAFASLGAVYLVGSAVATAAPTPGGLGATEAALVAGLIAVGVDNEAAVPAVFLFRLGTF